ncbi:hypothetical protein P3342_013372 [Pyrenophora teres f. teres]|uniref:Uncharacterized protein n=1 Tax=Pyrenophora teres f. teres TaxID=97479 RepID=A0A6S6WR14_9PLEO|nr:hypothetical protein HRS9139_09732 [Pyrenophora teres f. teres]KAE8823536.1 hypothetical protein PTNB85_10038 [Pyrenophora teres f. teres]KAE8854497.1 hypothetical protein PTNB29_09853 [Pyrenophora teres f. teres]KAK1908052.1 hypothetical protein P3342_013372 [Pyrenophora teres f. teres]CAE7219208.1 hypothetical protein PTTW11_11142 [Pyrenophora teres f. teres]
MSTTIVTTRRRDQTTTSTASRRQPSTFSTLRYSSTKPSPSSGDPSPTPLPTNFASDFSFVVFETKTPSPSPSATDTNSQSSPVGSTIAASESCSTDNDCAANTICSSAKCAGVNDAAPFGGSGPEPTSQLSTGAAIGVGVGLVAVVALLVALGFWFRRFRRSRERLESTEAASGNRHRSTSTATDQKTLVASLPSSPQSRALNLQRSMNAGPDFFAKTNREKMGHRRPESTYQVNGRNSTEKALPLPPLNGVPLATAPTDSRLYAVNVNINKSMIFDDDMMNAVNALRATETPRHSSPLRAPTPRYRFEEYVPPVTSTPPISISPAQAPTPTPASAPAPAPAPAPALGPDLNKRNSEYELDQYPRKTDIRSVRTASISDVSSISDSAPPSPIVNSIAPQLPLPDLPPPSARLSFRSYDWYQDIIGEPPTPTVRSRSPARTPTQATFPEPLSPSKKKPTHLEPSLMPAPLSPGLHTSTPGLHLHPSSAALPSPTNTNFRLSPSVYTPPPRRDTSPTPSITAMPGRGSGQNSGRNSKRASVRASVRASMRASLRASRLSTMTKNTHESRSWLPEDGLYLSEEGEFTPYEYDTFGRRSEDSRPTSYSPL